MKIGTDPEYVLVDSSGKYIPSIGLLGHDKDNPLPVPGGAILEDGVNIELNVEPATSAKEFVENINRVKQHADSLFSNFGLFLKPIPSATFKEEDLQSPQAQESGCDPDFCIYNKSKYEPNIYPALSDTNVRYAGGHIHIEDYESVNSPVFMERFITYLDLFISVPLNYIKWDKYRGSVYGRPGTYRPKEYGLEYRSPDNTWLSSDKSIEWAFDQVIIARKSANMGRLKIATTINKAILSNNTEMLRAIMKDYNIAPPRDIL